METIKDQLEMQKMMKQQEIDTAYDFLPRVRSLIIETQRLVASEQDNKRRADLEATLAKHDQYAAHLERIIAENPRA